MAASRTTAGEAPQSLNYKTWVLKVSIHCQGCKRQVKRALQSIDGVYTTTIDTEQHKVTVIGNIDSDTLVKKLAKSGKHAEIWPQNSAIEMKNMDNQKDPKPQSLTNNGSQQQNTVGDKLSAKNPSMEATVNFSNESKTLVGKKGIQSSEKTGTGHGGKKKKSEGQKGTTSCGEYGNGGAIAGTGSPDAAANHGTTGQGVNHPEDLSHTPHPSLDLPFIQSADQESTPMYVLSYSAAHPSIGHYGLSHQVTSQPFIHASVDQEENFQGPLNSFYVFSEENPNGCSVM
ncbi:hypothetical protein Ancab_030573 [Ancistrocladus abbreviatus]